MDDEEPKAKFMRELRDVQNLLAEGSISETEAKARSMRILELFTGDEDGKHYFISMFLCLAFGFRHLHKYIYLYAFSCCFFVKIPLCMVYKYMYDD